MRVTIEGDTRVAKIFQTMYENGVDTEPAMELVANRWVNLVHAGFKQQKDPWGKAWKANLRGGKILRDKGHLDSSISRRSSKTTATVGTNRCYAIAHQEGATITAGKPSHMSLCGYKTKAAKVLRFQIGDKWIMAKKVKIPRRAIFPDRKGGGLPKDWEEEAADMLVDHLSHGAKQ